ncbi:hypothetical protein AB1N83_011058 [Pleurotus pulmonarius]
MQSVEVAQVGQAESCLLVSSDSEDNAKASSLFHNQPQFEHMLALEPDQENDGDGSRNTTTASPVGSLATM